MFETAGQGALIIDATRGSGGDTARRAIGVVAATIWYDRNTAGPARLRDLSSSTLPGRSRPVTYKIKPI